MSVPKEELSQRSRNSNKDLQDPPTNYAIFTDELSSSSPPYKKSRMNSIQTWPVSKPTTRLSSRAKARTSVFDCVPAKMKDDVLSKRGSQTKTNTHTFSVLTKEGSPAVIDIGVAKINSKSVLAKEDIHVASAKQAEKGTPSVEDSDVANNDDSSIQVNEGTGAMVLISQDKEGSLLVDQNNAVVKYEDLLDFVKKEEEEITDMNVDIVPYENVRESIYTANMHTMSESKGRDDDMGKMTCEEITSDRVHSQTSENSNLSDNGNEEVGSNVQQIESVEMRGKGCASAESLGVYPSQSTDLPSKAGDGSKATSNFVTSDDPRAAPSENLHVLDRPSRQDLPKSSSDIETIICALEEELKKAGSSSGSISITKGQDMSQTSETELVKLIPKQEIVSVENVEDIIWNEDGTVQLVGNQTLIDAGDLVTVGHEEEVDIHSIDAQYDVVEYEVQAEQGKVKSLRGRRKRKGEEKSDQDKEILDRTCPMCHRVLTYPSSMAAHMRIHTGDRPYSCGQCDRKFTTKANRDRHEATHVGLKPFKCTECEKCFTEKRSLKIHMRSHTGERPFVCTVCDRGFTQKCTLLVHMDRHTDKKGHMCTLCGKAFRQKCQLDIHVKRHNKQANYPCPDCSIKCYTKGDLVRHMIKHTGERPYPCTLCPRTFTRKQYLEDHQNTHYGRKPYKCSVCSLSFHDMGSSYRHVRKHREEESTNKGKQPVSILTADDYDTIVKGSHVGKLLTLDDGGQAVVTAVETGADGSVVYHIQFVNSVPHGDKAQENALSEIEQEVVHLKTEVSESQQEVHSSTG